MPKLLIMASEFPPGPGGIGTHAYQLSLHLAKLGWNVEVLSAQEHAAPHQIAAFNAQLPITLHSVQGTGVRKAVGYLDCLHKLSPDLMLASGLRPLWYASMQSRIPYIAMLHGRELRFGGMLQQPITRRALQRAACVVPVSKYTNQQMIKMGITPRRMQVIPNGGDAARFTPADCQSPRPTLLTVGSVSQRKGQDIVIRALPRILEALPDAVYQIAGAPFGAEELASLAHQAGVWDHVDLLGIVPPEQLVDLYRCCDVFIMTSRHTRDDFEGYGIAVIEAALCGKPAIVSAGSGLEEAVIDGITGIVVPQDSPDAAAQAVITLLSNSQMKRQMGQAAYQCAITEQSWDVRAAEYHELLCSLVNT